MTTTTVYRCNVCEEEIDETSGIGLSWKHQSCFYLSKVMVTASKTHLCNSCVEGIYQLHVPQQNDRCSECGGSLDDDGDGTRCHLCCEYISPEDQRKNDAMERGDYERDRAKDEKSARNHKR